MVGIGSAGRAILGAESARDDVPVARPIQSKGGLDRPRLLILGCRGVPAAHGGFETFAQHLSLYLVDRGWDVEVACQIEGEGEQWTEVWRGVRRVCVPVAGNGPAASIMFDWKCTLYALRQRSLVLLLGYNTAAFAALLRLRGVPVVINMDGLEWKRSKWPLPVKAWFWGMERVACHLGTHLVADHPAIADHLTTRIPRGKVTCIAYCADKVADADPALVRKFDLEPQGYSLVVARSEPENSILEIVTAHQMSDCRLPLVVLGSFDDGHPYQRAVRAAARRNVRFLGPIYDKATLEAFRQHAAFYVHGHQVGGTNPSLVEALAAGSPVLAHDNRFNRWVAGADMRYFASVKECAIEFYRLEHDAGLLARMRRAARERHDYAFTQSEILSAYETLLQRFLPVEVPAAAVPAAFPR